MGVILGLGMTHVPLLAGRDEDMARILRRVVHIFNSSKCFAFFPA